ncbi:hypothetical protein AB1Y20_012230 [Prymnesium parvum]|uniref:Uncharacterized protein n=1 Tax=Prymnesium parvum TaxID=97485 RepID=A0AB34IMW4_PRYPA
MPRPSTSCRAVRPEEEWCSTCRKPQQKLKCLLAHDRSSGPAVRGCQTSPSGSSSRTSAPAATKSSWISIDSADTFEDDGQMKEQVDERPSMTIALMTPGPPCGALPPSAPCSAPTNAVDAQPALLPVNALRVLCPAPHADLPRTVPADAASARPALLAWRVFPERALDLDQPAERHLVGAGPDLERRLRRCRDA